MKFQQTPSQLANLPEFFKREYQGLNEWFWCHQFDEAVLIIGNAIEAKTYERDEDGKDKYSVSDILDGKLLDDVVPKETPISQLSRSDPRINSKPTVRQ